MSGNKDYTFINSYASRNKDIFIIFRFFLFFLFVANLLFHQAEAGLGTPSLSISITSPSQIERGESGSVAVTISETGGQDWAKDVSATVTISPVDGVVLDSQTKSVSRIDASSYKTLYFTLSTSKTASVGVRIIKVNVVYYDTGWLDVGLYGPHYATASATFTIKESHGTIEVSSTPNGADIYIDGNYIGITPKTISEVLVGWHTVVLKKSGYHEISKTIEVKSDQTTHISETLILQTGSIKIFSDPIGAEVYFDGTYKGVTPITLSNVPIGTHTVVLKKFGYAEWSQSVNIQVDRTIEVNPSLELFITTGFAPLGLLIVGLVILLVVGIVWRRNRKPKSAVPTEEPKGEFKAGLVEKLKELDVKKPKESAAVSTKSAYEYKGAKIYYKIKIENSTSETIGDIKVHLFVPDVFILKEKEKSISMLEPKESKTVTFEIRPTGECGDCNVSGKIEYYDYSTKKREMFDIETKTISVVCPVLKRKEIDVKQWERVTDELIKAEENIKELSVPAENLFNIASRVIKDNGMFMLKPETTSTPQLFNGIAMFYAEGVTGLRYAAYIEVVGGVRKSRMILKVWAEKEEALTGFYHRILDEIEKRVDVKIFIDDSLVQYHVTTIKDSIIQRSRIGAGTAKCPNCGRELQGDEKFCMGCGAKLD